MIAAQIDYYRERAPEYDEWFDRTGRYDRGPRLNRTWFEEAAMLRRAVAAAAPSGRILELAAGTGIWTEFLAPLATELTAVDVSPEMLAINRGRVRAGHVRYVEADLFHWEPPRKFDFVFFGFWLSHVPPSEFERFWSTVGASLSPSGRVFFVDSQSTPDSTARDHELRGRADTRMIRRLNDGREFEIIKVFYDPSELRSRLMGLGWEFDMNVTPNFFLYGHGRRSPSRT